jgi:hypothetical protein
MGRLKAKGRHKSTFAVDHVWKETILVGSSASFDRNTWKNIPDCYCTVNSSALSWDFKEAGARILWEDGS